MNVARLENAQPHNAAKLVYLAKRTPAAPTLAHRAEHLAGLHAMGHTLPGHTADAQARAAWDKREALAASATRPRPAGIVTAQLAGSGAKVSTLAKKDTAPAVPAKPYAERLRAALDGTRLTPAARSAITAGLARLGE